MTIKDLRFRIASLLVAAGILWVGPSTVLAQYGRPCPCPCPPVYGPHYSPQTILPAPQTDGSVTPDQAPTDQPPSPDSNVPTPTPDAQTPDMTAPPQNFNPAPAPTASASGGASGPVSAAPGMIGDSTIGNQIVIISPGGSIPFGTWYASPPGGGFTRFKIAENTNPLPTDRVFFNYNHFNGAGIHNNGTNVDIDTFTFGVEKTALDGCMSLELRVPFAAGFGADQVTGQQQTDTEFGNLGLAVKALLWSDCSSAVTCGLTATLPTGPDGTLSAAGGTPQVFIDNESVRLAPYLGFVCSPSQRLFTTAYMQWEFDVNGNGYTDIDQGVTGTLQDSNLMYLDWQVGYWMYRDPCRKWSIVQGIAPIFELHYTTAISDADVNATSVSYQSERFDVLNCTGALHCALGGGKTIRFAGVAPFTSDQRFFDAEFSIQVNCLY